MLTQVTRRRLRTCFWPLFIAVLLLTRTSRAHKGGCRKPYNSPARSPSTVIRMACRTCTGRPMQVASSGISGLILSSKAKFTFDEWTRAATDTRVLKANAAIPELIAECERLKAADAPRAWLNPSPN
jgi:hypothetical protein